MDREGFVRGLYLPGQPWNCVAVALSRFAPGLYPTVRDSLLGSKSQSSVRPDVMAVVGLLSGSFAYLLSAPLWLLKTRSQAESQFGSSFKAPPLPLSLGGYWTGSTPLVLRGALITAGWTSGYDATKRLVRDQQKVLSDGPLLQGVAGVVAGIGAATLSAPADVLQTRMQSSRHRTSFSAFSAAPTLCGATRAPPASFAAGPLASLDSCRL